jgi:hypothetical protein
MGYYCYFYLHLLTIIILLRNFLRGSICRVGNNRHIRVLVGNAQRHLLQADGSSYAGETTKTGLPWEPVQRSGSPTSCSKIN